MTGLKRYLGLAPSMGTLLACLWVVDAKAQPVANPEPQVPAQDSSAATPSNTAAAPETLNWFYQATSIGDYHGAFPALYSGAFSLQPNAEHDVSLTTTLFLGFRPFANTQIYIDPEVAGAGDSAASMALPTRPTASCRASHRPLPNPISPAFT